MHVRRKMLCNSGAPLATHTFTWEKIGTGIARLPRQAATCPADGDKRETVGDIRKAPMVRKSAQLRGKVRELSKLLMDWPESKIGNMADSLLTNVMQQFDMLIQCASAGEQQCWHCANRNVLLELSPEPDAHHGQPSPPRHRLRNDL